MIKQKSISRQLTLTSKLTLVRFLVPAVNTDHKLLQFMIKNSLWSFSSAGHWTQVCRSEDETRFNSQTVSRPHTLVINAGIYSYLLLSYLKKAGDVNGFKKCRNKLETWKHIQAISYLLNHIRVNFQSFWGDCSGNIKHVLSEDAAVTPPGGRPCHAGVFSLWLISSGSIKPVWSQPKSSVASCQGERKPISVIEVIKGVLVDERTTWCESSVPQGFYISFQLWKYSYFWITDVKKEEKRQTWQRTFEGSAGCTLTADQIKWAFSCSVWWSSRLVFVESAGVERQTHLALFMEI